MSLYSEYVMEREGYNCIEEEDYFYTYKKIGEALYLRDMYVRLESRRKGKAREIVTDIENKAKELNCNRVITTVDKETNNWEVNKKGIMSAGFVVLKEDSTIYFVKELEYGK